MFRNTQKSRTKKSENPCVLGSIPRCGTTLKDPPVGSFVICGVGFIPVI